MSHYDDLSQFLERFQGQSILVIGDICLDKYVRGDVKRVSSEAPIPVMVAKQERDTLGQAGNTFANLKGLGIQPIILGVIGGDEDGQRISELVSEAGNEANQLVIVDQSFSTVKTRFLSAHQQVFRVDREPNHPYSQSVEQAILDKIPNLIGKVSAVVLSDYGYGVLTPTVTQAIIQAAKKQSIPVLVDPRGYDFSKYKGATVVTPNRQELSLASAGLPTDSDADVIRAANHVLKTSGIDSIVATRSQDGMTIMREGHDPVHLKTIVREVYDVSGAGDTVISTLAACLSVGIDLVEAAKLATLAAGIVVGKVGTAPIQTAELKDAIAEQSGQIKFSSPIQTWDNALAEIERWRSRGLKVGFTNGCFDILHAGHVNYLTEARKRCDKLVLGLNYDSSIRLLKGSDRPVNDEVSRATVIAGLGCVDMVVLFGAQNKGEDNTAKALIETFKPDVYFKGDDYTLDTLPEAKYILSYGGRVDLIPLTVGLSTTKTIEKMKKVSGG
jgi:D-beta-D-heptose 7-phosphate kinase/D-beta-D-heptose 1-phosphate adenosyltransferase